MDCGTINKDVPFLDEATMFYKQVWLFHWKASPMPHQKKLKQWFSNMSDGFGLAFQWNNQVRILKGAMSKRQMLKLVAKMKTYLQPLTPTDVDVVIQYRQAVTGKVCRKYCHPFPITAEQEELDALDVCSQAALTHNGVIWEYNKQWHAQSGLDINDAQEFIKEYLAGMGEALWNPVVQRLIGDYADSKFALLSPTQVSLIGDFIEDKGLLFSNLSYNCNYIPYDWQDWRDWEGDKDWTWNRKRNLAGRYPFTWHEVQVPCDWCRKFTWLTYECYESHICFDCLEMTEAFYEETGTNRVPLLEQP